MENNIVKYLKYNKGQPVVYGHVESISSLERLKPWISDIVSESVFDGKRVYSKLRTKYDASTDLYSFRLMFYNE
jgi:hypothetical protein